MKNIIDAFIADENIAVVGVSRDKQKWGQMLFTGLRNKGDTVYAVNPKAEEVQGLPCFPDPTSIGDTPGLVIVVVAPKFVSGVMEE